MIVVPVYLAIRLRDLRSLQRRLAALELSSLRRAESHVLAMVDTILEVLHRLTGNSAPLPPQEAQVITFDSGEWLLCRRH